MLTGERGIFPGWACRSESAIGCLACCPSSTARSGQERDVTPFCQYINLKSITTVLLFVLLIGQRTQGWLAVSCCCCCCFWPTNYHRGILLVPGIKYEYPVSLPLLTRWGRHVWAAWRAWCPQLRKPWKYACFIIGLSLWQCMPPKTYKCCTQNM